ncbi:hypothetical protein KO500_06125 [Cellulophaga baltica]|uniref:DUF6095 family protein n=1 Tax=Cellulophaga TaxID=104264 RepID=UPI001C06C5A1|nr:MULTISPECIES: DUF6095 family protein [Cellulophaga]MBU2996000.1 hypothetical protein [Cellulophaga baltica]MDO6767395.1 DUF6095 family protein [Cellulophaga sp. 1_MG-2023]
MHTNKELLAKGIKRLGLTVLLMFLAPFTIYEAFKNETHPWYLPVLIIGLLLAITAIVMAFYSIKTIMDSLFNKK